MECLELHRNRWYPTALALMIRFIWCRQVVLRKLIREQSGPRPGLGHLSECLCLRSSPQNSGAPGGYSRPVLDFILALTAVEGWEYLEKVCLNVLPCVGWPLLINQPSKQAGTRSCCDSIGGPPVCSFTLGFHPPPWRNYSQPQSHRHQQTFHKRLHWSNIWRP